MSTPSCALRRVGNRGQIGYSCQLQIWIGAPRTIDRSICEASSLNRRKAPMHLTPREQEKLMIVVAADLARKRQARGLKLNYVEAISILSAEIMESARDGKSVAEIM